jgi:hypothetical protein
VVATTVVVMAAMVVVAVVDRKTKIAQDTNRCKNGCVIYRTVAQIYICAHYRTVLYLCTSTVYTWPPSVGNMCSFRQFRGHTLPPTVVHPYIRPVGILRYKIFGQ